MAALKNIREFLDQKNLVIAGVSRSGKNIGNAIFRELKTKNYNTFQLNPNAEEIEGEKCYTNFNSLPENVTAAVLCVKPEESLSVVKDAYAKGIKNIWMQLGSDSKEAIDFCNENGINCIAKECVFMFAEPVESMHKFHRFFWKIFGKYPK